MRAPFVVREVDGERMRVIRLPRRVKDDHNGRRRGRVRRRLLKRFYRRLADRFSAWETYRTLSERDLKEFRAALLLDMRGPEARPRTIRFCTYRIALIEHILRERAAGRDFQAGHVYRPDHNGECLTCDEPASEH